MLLIRWIFGMPMAALITAGLFFMMAQLIKDRNEPLPPARPDLKVQITAQKSDTEINEIKPPTEVLKQKPPETDFDFPPTDRTRGPRVDPEPFEIDRTPPTEGGVMAGRLYRRRRKGSVQVGSLPLLDAIHTLASKTAGGNAGGFLFVLRS